MVTRHPTEGNPALPAARKPVSETAVRRVDAEVVILGGGPAGMAAKREAERAGQVALVLDSAAGQEIVAIYPGPTVVARTSTGMLHVQAGGIVVATGAAEVHPVCPGNRLAGLVTARAAQALHEAGVDLGRAVAVGAPPAGVPCDVVEGGSSASKATTPGMWWPS